MSGGTTPLRHGQGRLDLAARSPAGPSALVVPMGPTRGQAWVWIDGVLAATIDTYRSVGGAAGSLFSRDLGDGRQHTRSGSSCSGPPGHPRVDVDAFLVHR